MPDEPPVSHDADARRPVADADARPEGHDTRRARPVGHRSTAA